MRLKSKLQKFCSFFFLSLGRKYFISSNCRKSQSNETDANAAEHIFYTTNGIDSQFVSNGFRFSLFLSFTDKIKVYRKWNQFRDIIFAHFVFISINLANDELLFVVDMIVSCVFQFENANRIRNFIAEISLNYFSDELRLNLHFISFPLFLIRTAPEKKNVVSMASREQVGHQF